MAFIKELAERNIYVTSTDIDMVFMHYDKDKSGTVERDEVRQHLALLEEKNKPQPPIRDFTNRQHRGVPKPRTNQYLFAKAQFSPRAPPGMTDTNMAW